jgi:vesicle-fusing ATPase
MIDGVNSLNNILVIGMTNRRDLLDSAILRAGRFEVQIEIGLPNEEGRLEILKIHTKELRRNRVLENVDLKKMAKITKNYTGAEIAALIQSANTFAFSRIHDIEDFS